MNKYIYIHYSNTSDSLFIIFFCGEISLGLSLGPLQPSFFASFPCFGVDLFPLLLVRILITVWSIIPLHPLIILADFGSFLEEGFDCTFLFSSWGFVPRGCNFTPQLNIDFRDPFRSCCSHGLNTKDFAVSSQLRANPGNGLVFFDSASVLIFP